MIGANEPKMSYQDQTFALFCHDAAIEPDHVGQGRRFMGFRQTPQPQKDLK
jgi:hypothetical protein